LNESCYMQIDIKIENLWNEFPIPPHINLNNTVYSHLLSL
jgi:hypothetical protein